MPDYTHVYIDGFVQRYTYSGEGVPSKVERLPLSSSLNGRQIVVEGEFATTATVIHQAPSGENSVDEVFLYAYNNSTGDSAVLELYWGEVSTLAESIIEVPYQSARYNLIDGKLIQNGLKVYAISESLPTYGGPYTGPCSTSQEVTTSGYKLFEVRGYEVGTFGGVNNTLSTFESPWYAFSYQGVHSTGINFETYPAYHSAMLFDGNEASSIEKLSPQHDVFCFPWTRINYDGWLATREGFVFSLTQTYPAPNVTGHVVSSVFDSRENIVDIEVDVFAGLNGMTFHVLTFKLASASVVLNLRNSAGKSVRTLSISGSPTMLAIGVPYFSLSFGSNSGIPAGTYTACASYNEGKEFVSAPIVYS